MKKTLLITLDFPPLTGGIANYYYNRVKKMQVKSIVVLVHVNNDANKYEYHANDFKTVYKKFFTKLIWPHWLPLIWHVYKVAKKENIEMIWVGQVLPVGSAVWLVVKLLNHGILKQVQDDKKIKFFVTCHGNDLLRAKSVSRKFKLAKKILQQAEYVEANTQFTKNILIKDFNIAQDKIKIIYPECSLSRNMVDENKVEELREKYGLQDKKVLLTVARLVKSKGVDNVLKALPKVLENPEYSGPDLVYIIVGDGPEMNKLKNMANETTPPFQGGDKGVVNNSLIGANIIFTGNVSFKELANYYALADVFILTPRKINTDTESFGIVYLEAKEFDLPVIAGDVGGVREIDYDKITLVDSEDINEISNKIVKLLNG